MGLTIAGGLAAGAGIGLFLHHEDNPTESDNGILLTMGTFFLSFAGGAMLATGIPLWIAGEYDIEVPADHPKAIRQRASAELMLAPGGAGVAVRF